MRDDPIQKAVGARMKQAAVDAGFVGKRGLADAAEIAKEMKRSIQTVYAWWRGDRAPEPEERERYAELVGKSPWWFYQFEEQNAAAKIAVLQELMTAVLQDNRPASAVVIEALGATLSAADREALIGEDADFQADLLAGRIPLTEKLSPAEQQQLQDFLRDLIARRGQERPG